VIGTRLARFGRVRFASDHDLGRFDDSDGVVPAPQFQFLDRIARDDGGQGLIADPEAHLSEQAFASHFLDEPSKPIATAQRDNQAWRDRSRPRSARQLVGCHEPIEFDFGDAMMATLGARRSHAALVDPLLQRGVSDSQPRRGGANGQ
jgi:hypothetical protein